VIKNVCNVAVWQMHVDVEVQTCYIREEAGFIAMLATQIKDDRAHSKPCLRHLLAAIGHSACFTKITYA
jgi:hypothetical protein